MSKTSNDELVSRLTTVFEPVSRGSKKISVEKIVEKYLLLMALCVVDEEVRTEFENDPRTVLERFIPEFNIPPQAIIMLDRYESLWPTVTFSDDNVTCSYKELGLNVVEDIYPSNESDDGAKVINQDYYGRKEYGQTLKINVNKSRGISEGCKIVITLPYFSYKTDIITEYKYSDNEAPVILSTCS